jgi:hypothetical protein
LICERSSWHFTMMPVGQVEDLHRAVGGVDALPPGAARRRDADLQVAGLVDLHVDLVGLGQHGHGGRRGVDPPLGLGRRHALHPVDAALEAQRVVHTRSPVTVAMTSLIAADEGLARRRAPRPSSARFSA